MEPVLHIGVKEAVLRQALLRRLSGRFTVSDSPGGLPHPATEIDVVVVTSADLTAEECAQLTAKGTVVIVLAAVPRMRERERYLRSGAKGYNPMTLDVGELERQILDACGIEPLPQAHPALEGATAAAPRLVAEARACRRRPSS